MKSDISRYVKPWVHEVPPYEEERRIKDLVRLGSNENNHGPSPHAVRALLDNSRFAFIYPHQQKMVREKIAGILEVKPDNVVIGSGLIDVVDGVLKAFKGPVLSVYPTIREYEICAKALGEAYLKVKLKNDFSLPLDELLSKSKEANVIIVANPNNPTGGVTSEEDLKRILDEGKITVVDESYYEFYGKTALPLASEYNNLIILQTLSHAYALAGLRIAYAIACSEAIKLISKVKPTSNLSSLALEAALEALHDDDYMIAKIKEIRRDRETIHKELAARFKPFTSHANFILVDVSPMKSKEFCDKAGYYGFDVKDLGRFEGFPGEYVRISIGTWEENNKFVHFLSKM